MNLEQEIQDLKKRIEVLEGMLLKSSEPSKIKESANRDKTKFMYNGKVYPKNRLVLAIITDYAKNTNPTFDVLCKTFDKSLQGSLNVVETFDNASKISDASKRYFMKQEDIINLSDGTNVVICTQWGIFNINRFVKVAQSLGYKIDLI